MTELAKNGRILTSLLLLALCCCSLLTSSCSIVVNFVIVNQSPDPIQITMELKQNTNNYFENGLLAKQVLSNNKYDYQKWVRLSVQDYERDQSTNRIALSLNPQEALRVESITNYDEDRPGSAERFRIKSLRISGAGGEIVHAGEQARVQFLKTGDGTREIVYK